MYLFSVVTKQSNGRMSPIRARTMKEYDQVCTSPFIVSYVRLRSPRLKSSYGFWFILQETMCSSYIMCSTLFMMVNRLITISNQFKLSEANSKGAKMQKPLSWLYSVSKCHWFEIITKMFHLLYMNCLLFTTIWDLHSLIIISWMYSLRILVHIDNNTCNPLQYSI